MKFDDARAVDMITYQMKESDWVRGQDRARINDLFNGLPPYTPDEMQANNIQVNINDLASTRAGHSARSQYYTAFLQQDRFFSARTDMGKPQKRDEYNTIVTNAAAKIMKRSLLYFECCRSKFASNVLHGISPSAWEDKDKWCPDPLAIDDVLIPAETLITMKNLPFFAIRKSYTAPELIKLTQGPRRDKAWNMDLVNDCLEWVDKEAAALMGTSWPTIMSPEKIAERKMDRGFYAGDKVPTIDCFDFYFWSDEKKNGGWRRRTILDAWGSPDATGAQYRATRRKGKPFEKDDRFLFDSRDRKYADRLSELITWQFADLSAVSPFLYHSVRSLGKLLYAVCHLQNRLRSRFNEAVFESMMQYFRVSSEDEYQRALKVDMINRGFIDNSVKFVPPAERWQYNVQFAELAMAENRQLIDESTASYAQRSNFSQDRTEKTKFQVMAELQGMTAMLNAALMQAFQYAAFEYHEIFRRLMKPNSRDPDVIEFRNICLRQQVPEKLMCYEAWDVQPVQVSGAGNHSLQMMIAQQLLEMRPLYQPQAQEQILRDVTQMITQDPQKTKIYCPPGPPRISNSIHDAQQSVGTILAGGRVDPVEGQLHQEVIETWLNALAQEVQKILQMGGVPSSVNQLAGLQNLAAHIAGQIVIFSSDKEEKSRVASYSQALTELTNELKAFGQRLEEQMQAQNGNGGLDPKVLSQMQADIIKAQGKNERAAETHAQKTAQKQLAFEQQQRQKAQDHQLEIAARAQEADLELAVEGARARIDLTKAAATAARPKNEEG